MLSNEMTVNFYVLSSLMEDIIMSYLDGTPIVTKSVVGFCWSTPKSASNQRNQTSSEVVSARAWHSALVLQRATTLCFLLRYEIKESPKKKQQPVVEHRSVGSLAQSESE